MSEKHSSNRQATQEGLPFFCAWDATGLRQSGSGIHRYAACLYPELQALGVQPLVMGPAAPPFTVHGSKRHGGRLGEQRLLSPWFSLRSLERSLPHAANRRGLVLHGLANLNILALGKRREAAGLPLRQVVTIHDLTALLPGSGASLSYRLQFRYALPRVVAAADRIVCVSQWTARLLLERYPAAASKLVVIANGVPARHPSGTPLHAHSVQTDESCLRLLSVGRHEPYKRLDLLVAALDFLPAHTSLTLVTDAAGVAYWSRQAAEACAQGRLLLRQGLSDAELTAAYQAADLYLQPSLYEGYGLPAVEALAAGVPVLYQAGSGADEVLGESGVAWPMPLAASAEDWAIAMEGSRGHKHTAAFASALDSYHAQAPRWSTAARELRTVYNSLI